MKELTEGQQWRWSNWEKGKSGDEGTKRKAKVEMKESREKQKLRWRNQKKKRVEIKEPREKKELRWRNWKKTKSGDEGTERKATVEMKEPREKQQWR